MQCSACRAVFSNGLDTCPRCKSALPPAKSAATAAVAAATTEQTQRDVSSSATQSASSRVSSAVSQQTDVDALSVNVSSDNLTTAKTSSTTVATSTLLEFPGANRNMPQWRKDLSERVREIQERRAREAAREAEEAAYRRTTQVVEQEIITPQSLGLITSPEAPPMNPLVVAALRRIERARQPTMPRARMSSGGGAATAVARVAEEQYNTEPALLSAKDTQLAEKALQQQKAHNLVVVAPKPTQPLPELPATEPAPETKSQPMLETSAKTQLIAPTTVSSSVELKQPIAQSTAAATEQRQPGVATGQSAVVSESLLALPEAPVVPQTITNSVTTTANPTTPPRTPRKVFDGVVDDAMLARREAEKAASAPAITSSSEFSTLAENYDDRAPVGARLVANLIDLIVVSFLASPCAAIIELTSGNWADLRVFGSMAGLFVVILFFYATVSTLLVGRTWGMSLVSLRAVDAETGLQPSTRQAMARSAIYIFSLALCGLGILYALFDAEGRTLHDHLSGTVMIRD